MKVLEILVEAPLADYQTHGDFDSEATRQGALNKTDRKLVKHEVHAKKMEKFFAKSPFNFRIIVTNNDEGYELAGEAHGQVKNDAALRDVGLDDETIDSINKNKANAITCILTGNDTDDPLTPWIHAHRIGHMYDDATRAKLTKALESLVYEVLEKHYENIPKEIINRESAIKGFMKKTLTMKSARKGKLFQIQEGAVELFAQYIVKGKVELNAFPKEVTWRGYVDRKFQEMIATPKGELGEAHAKLEKALDDIIEGALKDMVGKIYLY